MKVYAITALAAFLSILPGCVATQGPPAGRGGVSAEAPAKPAARPDSAKVKEGGSKNGMTAMAGSMEWETDASFVGSSNAKGGDYSFGRYEFVQAPRMPLMLSANYQRLSGSKSRPVELYFPGGAFGVARDNWYLWETDSHWTGWKPIPGKANLSDGVNRLSVIQDGRDVVGFINNVEVGRFTLDKDPAGARASLFFKGDPGRASKVRFSDIVMSFGEPVSDTIASMGGIRKSSGASEYEGLGAQIAFGLLASWVGGAVRETVRQTNEAFSNEPYHMAGDMVRVCHKNGNFKAKVRQVKGDEIEIETAEALSFPFYFNPYGGNERGTPKGAVLDVPKRSVTPLDSSRWVCP